MNFKNTFILLSFPVFCFAQSDLQFKALAEKADSAYKAENYELCCQTYEQAFEIQDDNFFSLYRSSKCFALNKDFDKSFKYLNRAVDINWKYTCQWMEKDEKLRSLSQDSRWKELKEKCKKLKSSLNTQLQYELLSMQKKDQEWRSSIPDPSDPTYKAHLIKLQDIDEANTARMKEIVEEYGWPTFSLVGQVGGHAAWLLIQHADLDPVFQEKCLKLLEAAYKEGEASGNNFAYLYDRVMVNKGEKQKFGTQFYLNSINKGYEFYPIAEEVTLNQRRKEFDLNWSAEEYAKVMGFHYQPVDQAGAQAKIEGQQREYDEMIAAGEKLVGQKDFTNASKSFKRAMELTGYIQLEDILAGVEVLAKSKKDESTLIFAWLKMAAVRGWKNVEGLRKDKIYRKIKGDSRWSILENITE